MPKVTGIFEQFKDLDLISVDDISRWLDPQPPHFIENLLANHLLYPQTAPIRKEDLAVELAILREILRRGPGNYFNDAQKKISIPSQFLARFPDLNKLALAFIDGLNPRGIVHIVLGSEVLGSFIKIDFSSEKDRFEMMVQGKNYFFRKGELKVVDCPHHCHINFNSTSGQIEGKNQGLLELLGGQLGLVIDCREREK